MGDRDELVQRMRQAKAFTEDIVKAYLDEAEQKIFNKWGNSNKVEERDHLYLEYLALKEFRKFIRETIIKGEIAQKELNEKYEQEKAALNP